MKFVIAIIASLLFLVVTAFSARAALTFGAATSDRVNHGSDASLDNLDPFTYACWAYPTTFTANRVFVAKRGATDTGRFLQLNGSSGAVQVLVDRSTDTSYITSNTLSLNAWQFVAGTYNSGGAAGQISNIYFGTLTSGLSEATYGTATDGSGANVDEGTLPMVVGNNSTSSPTFAFQGRIAWCGIWNRELSLGELQAQQFRPHVTRGNVLFTHYGFNPTGGSQPDWSGNGNAGTITGAAFVSHVPLWRRSFGR